MDGNRNRHKEAAQRARAVKLVDAAERMFDINRRDAATFEALAEVLADAPDAQFKPLFEEANIHAHSKTQWCSEETRGFVVERLIDLATQAAKPIGETFAGLPS